MTLGKVAAGTLYFRIAGVTYSPQGDFTVGVGGVMRESIVGVDRAVHGYRETTEASFIEGTLTDSSGLSLSQLQAITDTTLQLELINGKVYTLQNAWCAKANEWKSDGTVAVRFEAKRCDERTA